MTKTQTIAAIIAIALLLGGMTAQLSTRSALPRGKPQETAVEVIVTDTYIAHAGDTLWSIAGEYCPVDMDKRDYIDDIVTRNQLDSAVLQVGQEIEIWKYEKPTQSVD